MVINYNKLWKILIDKKLSKTDLKSLAGVSSNVIAKLGREESVSLDSLNKICSALNCGIGDIMEFSEEKPNEIR